MKKKKNSRSTQHRFNKGKTYLTSLISFHNEMTGLMDEKRALDFSSGTSVRHLTLSPLRAIIEMQLKYEQDDQTVW